MRVQHPALMIARRLGLLITATAVLGACGTPQPPPPEPVPSPTGTPFVCPDSGVAISPGIVDSAMGLRAMGIEMVNCGTQPYTVNGFPTVRVLDADRQPLDIAVSHGSSAVSAPDSWDAPPKPVTLQPGDTVRARVLWRNTMTDSALDAAVTGTYLEIAPADGQPAQIVTPDGGIDLGNTGKLAVNAWTTGPQTGEPGGVASSSCRRWPVCDDQASLAPSGRVPGSAPGR